MTWWHVITTPNLNLACPQARKESCNKDWQSKVRRIATQCSWLVSFFFLCMPQSQKKGKWLRLLSSSIYAIFSLYFFLETSFWFFLLASPFGCFAPWVNNKATTSKCFVFKYYHLIHKHHKHLIRGLH